MKKVWQKFKKTIKPPRKVASGEIVSASAVVIPREQHNISRRDISSAAIKVLNRLHQAGYGAFLVGGGVRDLLLGMHPKDFDVTTDATPEQIRKLFSNSMIIGRRFRLVHVRYGREIIEVATFRGAGGDRDDPADETQPGILLNDNVYGSMEEDAFRRDFTVNALFYNIADFSLVDYCHGMRDLQSKQICVMGDPERRYREDPVRMLRAVRLSAKLGFAIEPASARPIAEMADLLNHVSPARLFDEFVKMLMGGKSELTFNQLQRYDLFTHLFAQTWNSINGDRSVYTSALIKAALQETDKRVNADKSINPAFMLAVLLWEPMQERVRVHQDAGETLYSAMSIAQNEVVKEQMRQLAPPRRIVTAMREIWMLQYQFSQTRKHRIMRAFEHPRFRAAYDFLLLRVQAGEPLGELAEWWTQFQQADIATQESMIDKPRSTGRPRRRRRSGPRKPPKVHHD